MVRWGIIGCGDVADRKSGPAFNQVEGSELVAVMRRDAAKSREFAKKHGAKKWYTKVENLLADEDINAIYVATPVHLHCEHTIAAADAGKHVLCEKPMAVNVAQCQQMIQACKSNGVKLMIAYYRRFYPSVKKMKEVMESGAIGDIVLARVNLTGYYNPSQPGEWRTDPLIAGGGVMMDVGSHRLDLLIHLLGDVEKVGAFVDTLHCNYAVEDSAALVMKFKSGAHAVSNFNWNVGSGSDDFEIYGTRGKILSRPLDAGNLGIYQGKEVQKLILPPVKITHLGVVENFVEALRTDQETICPGEEGMKTNLVIEAAYQSARTGRIIDVGVDV